MSSCWYRWHRWCYSGMRPLDWRKGYFHAPSSPPFSGSSLWSWLDFGTSWSKGSKVHGLLKTSQGSYLGYTPHIQQHMPTCTGAANDSTVQSTSRDKRRPAELQRHVRASPRVLVWTARWQLHAVDVWPGCISYLQSFFVACLPSKLVYASTW
jgi:hypothetical protein